jgi:hypothetical protein
LVERGFFKVEVGSHDIHVITPTKYHSKYMMRCQGKEQVEEGSSPTKVTQKRALVEAKKIQKMF